MAKRLSLYCLTIDDLLVIKRKLKLNKKNMDDCRLFVNMNSFRYLHNTVRRSLVVRPTPFMLLGFEIYCDPDLQDKEYRYVSGSPT